MYKEIENKTIVVTGGAGFIGSHLCRRLLLSNNNVICLDDLSTGNMNNISDLLSDKRFRFVLHDVTKPYYYKCDYLFNLACPASPVHYQADPIKTLLTNVLGATNALNNAKKYNAIAFQASTSEVYGDPIEHPQSESYKGNVNPNGIRACYDEGKRCAETLFFDYHRKFGLRIKVVRIFNTYGPNMQIEDGRVVSNFIVQALLGNDLTIYGDGTQTRSFCYIDDLIEGFIKMALSDEHFTGPCNLGNPGEYTMLELANAILEKTNSKSKIVFMPLPQDDPTKRKPNINLAKKMLSWEPTVSMPDGIDLTIDYFKKSLNL